MIINGASFSKNGRDLLKRLDEKLTDYQLYIREDGLSLSDWCRQGFETKAPLLFVGATGIAVRSIAPFLENKLVDSPVLVMDELGLFVIPLCGGHVGGANELAIHIANVMNAIPVITTATDLNDAFSVDLFAKENNLTIANKDGIKRVSARALEGKPVTISIKDYPPAEEVDVIIASDMNYSSRAKLTLKPKEYVLGIGCKRGKTYEEIMANVNQVLEERAIALEDIYAISTIDIKENEEGIVGLSRRHRIPVITYTAQLLKKAPGEFTSSSFVADTVGVDNVCERAAVLAAGPGAKLVVKKHALEGVTLALARRYLGQEDF